MPVALRRAPTCRGAQRPRDMFAHHASIAVARATAARRSPPASSAHCPARPRCCAASARSRCGGSPSLRCAAGIPSSFHANSCASVALSRSLRARKSGSSVRLANLFQGHTSWQSSQPKMRLPISGRSSSGIDAFVFDGQVGDAAARIEPVRRDDRLGRADVDAAHAGAAMRAGRRVDRQRQVDVDLAEEEPRAAVLVDQAGVLADPAQPGVARQRALEHRRRVDEHAMAERPDLLGDAVGELLQALPHQLVVVAAERVARDVGALAVGERAPRPRRRRRGRSPGRPRSPARVPGISSSGRERLSPWRAIQSIEPYRPLRQPVAQVRLVLAQFDVGDAAALEAELARQRADALRRARRGRRCGGREVAASVGMSQV